MKSTITSTILLSVVLSFGAQAKNAELYSLKNLERERAALIETQLSHELEADVKQRKVDELTRRIVDLERMVLRDDRLTNNNHPLVQKAFEHFDKTFLVHAGAENKYTPFEQWLSISKLNSDVILSARVGDK